MSGIRFRVLSNIMKNNNPTETKPPFPTFSKLFRWLFSWWIARRCLITLAVVVTLVVSF
jgi:hypothetical protein